MSTANVLPEGDRIVSAKERRAITVYCDVHYARLEKQDKVPKRIRLGPNRVGWSFNELQAWVTARKAERDAAAPTAQPAFSSNSDDENPGDEEGDGGGAEGPL